MDLQEFLKHNSKEKLISSSPNLMRILT